MTTKQLTVQIRAVDQASSILRGAGASVMALGRVGLAVSRSLAGQVLAITRSLMSVKTLLAGLVTGFVAGRIVGGLRATAMEIDEIAKAAGRLGLSMERMSELRYAAKIANVEFDALASSVATAEKNIGIFAATGGGKAAAAIKTLNIDLRDAGGGLRDMHDLVPEVIDAIRAFEDAPTRQMLASRIFGDEKILNLAGEDLKRLMTEAHQMGVVFTTQQATVADQYLDSLERLSQAWLGVKTAIVMQVAPPITAFLNDMAFKVARLPDLVRGAGRAFHDAFGSGGGDEESRALLLEAGRATMDVLIGGVVELGKAFALTALDVLRFGLATMGPVIADLFREGAAAIGVPFVDNSTAGKIRDGRTELLRLRRQREFVAANGVAFAGLPGVPSLNTELGRVDAAIQKLEADIVRWRKLLTAETATRQKDITESARELLDITDRFKEAAANIGMLSGPAGRALAKLSEIGSRRTIPAPVVHGFTPDLVDPFGGSAAPPGGGRTAITALMEMDDVLQDAAASSAKINMEFAELEARRLDLLGEDRAAARVRLLAAQAVELAEAYDQVSAATVPYYQSLERLQGLEVMRFDAETEAAATLRQLTGLEQRYTQALQERADAVTAGSLSELEASRRNRADAARVREVGEAAVERLRELIALHPELSAFLRSFEQQAVTALGHVGQAAAETSGTFRDGFTRGMGEVARRSRDLVEIGRQYSLDITGAIEQDLGTAVIAMTDDLDRAGEAWKEFGRSAVQQIQEITTRLLVMRLVGGIAGSFMGGASAGGGAQTVFGSPFMGGMRFANGGAVPGPSSVNRDIVPALLTPGEFVLSRSAVMRAGGTRAVQQFNDGGMVGNSTGRVTGGAVNISVIVNMQQGGANAKATGAMMGGTVGREVARVLIDELRRNPAARETMRSLV